MSTSGKPRIDCIAPPAALPGGEITIHGSGFATRNHHLPEVRFGEAEGSLVLSSDSTLMARVPEDAEGSSLRVRSGEQESNSFPIALARQLADNLHPVGNPAVDAKGSVYATFSGQRGQKIPVSLYKVTEGRVKPFTTELVNPTGLAMDHHGVLYVSCRNDGTVHRVLPDGNSSQWVEGMGVATGIAFDREGNLYVGDRSGTIFKIGPDREIFVFATLEPSMAAYHLAFSAAGDLYITSPTQSSFDRVYKISPAGEVTVFFRGLGRPQGLAFDADGNLYVAASLGGRGGIVRISPDAKAELVVSGAEMVGMALQPNGRAMFVTKSALYSLDWNVKGMPLAG